MKVRLYYIPKPKNRSAAKSAERDIYASFSKKVFVPSNIPLNKLKKDSNMIVESTRTDKGYIFHVKGKPHKSSVIHPVIMEEK